MFNQKISAFTLHNVVTMKLLIWGEGSVEDTEDWRYCTGLVVRSLFSRIKTGWGG